MLDHKFSTIFTGIYVLFDRNIVIGKPEYPESPFLSL